MKNVKKQSVLHDGQPTYHCDTLAADHTDCVKIVTLRRFDDDKYVGTDHHHEGKNIADINLENLHIKNHIISGQIIRVSVKDDTLFFIRHVHLQELQYDNSITIV
ncbi:unnamed protein product [Pocillopora meandrina]|uniref:Uncharacterized protein n=1 Tax=Pocillopora meandrina TaxID=46732 RepID=A0AAU9WGS5_9CNID|nr:unnamed protein product [Pocillopora meandrina]